MQMNPMRDTITAIQAEYLRYKSLAEAALAQLDEPQLSAHAAGQNSIATICWHVAGNLRSRFTDFLTSDGEKPWRDREDEFAPRNVSRAELLEHWERGWSALFTALEGLSDSDLTSTVTIRAQPLSVREALFRSLAHAAYHVGQVVYVAHALRGDGWKYLSIAPGKSAEYNAAPGSEKPAAHAERLRSSAKS
jgi:uncharacterized damage-inducible protein DinB